MKKLAIVLMVVLACGGLTTVQAEESVKIGLNYPKTGPYAVQGLDQLQAAQMAAEEINQSGGILGKKIELVIRDSQSKVDVTKQNVTELIDKEGVKMVFGGSASSVAIATGNICQEKGIPFFGTLTYSTETTCEDAHRCTFRECYDSWMAAKAIASYLKEKFPNKKYLYITADYTWGHTTEASMRKFTGTDDTETHKGIKTPFPGAKEEDFKKAISFAKVVNPDVLVLVLFGNDMVLGIRQATAQGLKAKTQIVVPNLTLGMAEGGGPKVMEGVIGALPWSWQVPYKYNFERGKKFVEDFAARHNRYPCTSGASAYTILYEYKAAAEKAGSLDTSGIIKALEGRDYTLLKDKQTWRAFDHQSIQTVYAVICKPEAEVLKDKFKLDYFEILSALPGDQAVRTLDEWTAYRTKANKPATLEPLPSEMAGSGNVQSK